MDEIKTSSYIDLRGLAFLRMAFGAIIFYMLLVRLPELRTFYTDWGILPRDVLIQKYTNPWMWSIYLISGNIFIVSIIYAFHFLINFLFFLGIQTRKMTILNWIFLVSLYERNTMILHGGDDILRLLLFIAIFLPLGAKYSIDSFLLNKDERPSENIHCNLATFGFILQFLCIYFFTSLIKNHPAYNVDGTAIWYALQLDRFMTPLGSMLSKLPPSATYLATLTVFYMECILPFVFLIPWRNTLFRYLVIGVFVIFHLGLSATMHLDYFPYVCIAAWLTLLPTHFWDNLELKLKQSAKKPITIYYDKECGFCTKITRIIQEMLFLPSNASAAAPGAGVPANLMMENHSWVIKSGDKYFTRYAGFHENLRQSPLNKIVIPTLISKLILKIGLGDFLYKLVSMRRSTWSYISSKISGRKTTLKHNVPTKIFLIMVITTIIYTNIKVLPAEDKRTPIPYPIWSFRNVFTLYQRWGLFAPMPSRDDGWLTIEGNLFNGAMVDIWNNGAPISDEKPVDFYKGNVKSALWNKYILNLWDKKNSKQRLYFGRYICRFWNDGHPNHDEQVSTFKIYYFLEKTPEPNSETVEPVKKLVFWSHNCWK